MYVITDAQKKSEKAEKGDKLWPQRHSSGRTDPPLIVSRTSPQKWHCLLCMASTMNLGAFYIQVRTGFHTGQFGGAFSQLMFSLPKWPWPLLSWQKAREHKWGRFEASRHTLLYTSRNTWTLCNTKYQYYMNNCSSILFRKKNQKKKDSIYSI
jgi:hypothetical protein